MKTRYDVRAFMDTYSGQNEYNFCKNRFAMIRAVLRYIKKYDCVRIVKRRKIGG